jgi:hypothetical protein
MCVPAAYSAVLSLRAVGGSDEATLSLGVSETGAIELVLELDEFEEAAGAHVFLDTVMVDPPGAEDDEAFGVIGVLREGDPDFVWTGVREFSPDPISEIEFEDLPPGEGFSIDGMGYFLVAMMAAGDSLPGGAGVSYILDRIIIHGMTPGTIELTFEGGLRPPEVFGPGWGKLPLALGLGDFGVDTGPSSQQRERQPITITVAEPGAPAGDEDGAGGDDPGTGDAGEGDEADDGATDSGGDESGDVIDEPGQEPDEGEDQTDTDGGDPAAPDDPDSSGDQSDTGEGDTSDTEGQPGDEDPEVPEAPDDSDQSSPDEVMDGSRAGGEGDETSSTGPGSPDDGDLEDSSGAPPVSGPCGFGVIPAILASLLGLFAMQPHSRRRR